MVRRAAAGRGATRSIRGATRSTPRQWHPPPRRPPAASEANTSGLRDDFIDHTEGSSKLLLHPLSKARQTWDIFLIVTLFAFAIFYPLRLSFLDPRGASPAWRAVDIALTAVFGFDILLTLRTSIVVDRTLILSPRKIALRYARGWLLVDLLAALPLDLLVARPAGGLNLWAWSRFIKVLRLYSLGQYRYFDKVMKAVDVHFGVMTYLKVRNSYAIPRNSAQFSDGPSILLQTTGRFAVLVCVCAHWFCCAWHLLGVAFSPSWGDGGGSDGGPQLELPLNEMAIGDAYVVSIYWAVTTMRTIGYGDIKPTNTAERLFAMFVMFVGAGIFNYGITNVVTAVATSNKAALEFRERLDALNVYMEAMQIPTHLRREATDVLPAPRADVLDLPRVPPIGRREPRAADAAREISQLDADQEGALLPRRVRPGVT